MKKFAILIAVSSMMFAPPLRAAGVEFKPFVGKVSYQEHAREVMYLESDWEGLLYGIKVELNELKRPGLGGAIEGTFWDSSEDDEEWEGPEYHQDNDMSVWGVEGKALLGFNFKIKETFTLTPLAGVSYRYQEFTRKQFVINYSPSSLEPVTEKYPLFNALGGINLNVALDPEYELFGRFIYSYVIDSQADNSQNGEIEGDHGDILTVEAGMQWTDGVCAVGCGLFWEKQDLKGGLNSSGTAEWPDNKLESVAVMGTFRFFF